MKWLEELKECSEKLTKHVNIPRKYPLEKVILRDSEGVFVLKDSPKTALVYEKEPSMSVYALHIDVPKEHNTPDILKDAAQFVSDKLYLLIADDFHKRSANGVKVLVHKDRVLGYIIRAYKFEDGRTRVEGEIAASFT